VGAGPEVAIDPSAGRWRGHTPKEVKAEGRRRGDRSYRNDPSPVRALADTLSPGERAKTSIRSRGFGGVVGSVLLGDGLERGVELHKGVVDGSVGVVAGEAGGAGIGRGAAGATGERKIGPLFGEALRVLDGRGQAAEPGLVMAAAVDGTPGGRVANLQNKHRTVRPAARLDELAPGRGLDKDVGELAARLARGTVFHAQPRGEINPLAVAARQQQPAVGRELRGSGIGQNGRGLAQAQNRNRRCRRQYDCRELSNRTPAPGCH